MRRSWAVIAAAGLAACARDPVIERAQVEFVIHTLAADSMAGRRAFTPAADQAARFLRDQFATIGLEPLDGLDDYLQRFSAYSLSVERARVVLNGRAIPKERVATVLSQASLHWSTGDSVRVVTVGARDHPMRGLGAVLRSSGNTLALFDPAHRQLFDQLRSGRVMPSRRLELDGARNIVVVLTNEPQARSFRVEVTAAVQEEPLANVAGMIPGRRRDEIVLFAAHYDHVGVGRPVNGDSIFNGANDNASGTTAVIELARYFKARGRPQRTLVFAAFTAEEAGGFGSRYFSQRLDPDRIVAMFNIEMIGKPAAQGPNHAWITGFELSSFGAILRDVVAGTGFVFEPDPYPQENLFYRSDNAALARLGVPAHSISTTPIDVDPDYHQVSDEVGTLDLDHLTNTIRGIARGAAPIVDGRATPTRVDTARVRGPSR